MSAQSIRSLSHLFQDEKPSTMGNPFSVYLSTAHFGRPLFQLEGATSFRGGCCAPSEGGRRSCSLCVLARVCTDCAIAPAGEWEVWAEVDVTEQPSYSLMLVAGP